MNSPLKPGDCVQPEPLIGAGRFYVYALLDPKNNIPFYVGKGTSNRIVDHFRVGRSPEEIFDEEDDPRETNKMQIIRDLTSKGAGAKDIARVVGRRLSEEVAFAIEGLLIKSVYGRGPNALTNIADGQHAERFRAKDEWVYISTYDLPTDRHGNFLADDGEHQLGEYYVYVLRNPVNGRIFYVGKGKGKRLCDHFQNAISNMASSDVERLGEIRKLFVEGHKPCDIGRIIARVTSEALAFMIESLYIKFVIGFKNLHNIQPGHASGLYRSHEDWELRKGFDIPIVVEKGQARDESLDEFLGEGLDIELQEVIDVIAKNAPNLELDFSLPKVHGARELVVFASIPDVHPGVKLRIQIRSARRFQVMLCPINKNKQGREWMRNHFTNLDAYSLLRPSDDMFIAPRWRGQRNVTSDPAVAADRALKLIALTRVKRREDLGLLVPLLNGFP